MDYRAYPHSLMGYWSAYCHYYGWVYPYSFSHCHHCGINKCHSRPEKS